MSLLQDNPAQNRGQQPVQVLGQGRCRRTGQISLRTDDDIYAVGKLTDAGAHEGPQDALAAVSNHRVAHGFGDDKTDPRRLTHTRVG